MVYNGRVKGQVVDVEEAGRGVREMRGSSRKVYLREDIENALKSVLRAHMATLRHVGNGSLETNAYRQGFVDALEALGANFGIDLDDLESPVPLPEGRILFSE